MMPLLARTRGTKERLQVCLFFGGGVEYATSVEWYRAEIAANDATGFGSAVAIQSLFRIVTFIGTL